MPWVITFVASWLIFLLLIDKNNLRTMAGGFTAVFLAALTDYCGVNWFHLYSFNDVVIPWGCCSYFYIFGVIFTMGALFTQFYPRKRWLKIMHVFVLSLLFLSLETLLTEVGVATYINWNAWASLFVNILALSTLGWITEIFQLNIKKQVF
ncbi:hypothetical protein KO465_06340 [Candidatus Micrarchaeota archaeon]|jgi:hypothetical protein|nr:hypothetical protein [Candidatus Micrarchaeota archaeon]